MSVFIHPLADVQTAAIGEHSSIWQFCVVLKGAIIGDHCNICSHCFIENDVRIGHYVTIKNGVQLWDGITVADHVFIGPNVTFCNDKYPQSQRGQSRQFIAMPTFIDEGASIGAGAVILPGITIGKRAIIAAGAIVTNHVPDDRKVIGVKASIR